ncbi:hypothetical protein RsoM2USA_90 [Ralstonia phage RsoM2USA]|nr:hypothetical protein RsoM2USA_90 [Ralstonia phage RsoM2USA]
MSFKTFLESAMDSNGFFTDMKSIMLFLQKHRTSQFKPDATTKQVQLYAATFTNVEEDHLPIRISKADNITIKYSKITSLFGLPSDLDRLIITGCVDLNEVSESNGLPRTHINLTLNAVGVNQLDLDQIESPSIQINECDNLESVHGGERHDLAPSTLNFFNCANLKKINVNLSGASKILSIDNCNNFKFGEDSIFNANILKLDGNLSLSGISISAPAVQYIQFYNLDGITNILSLAEIDSLRMVSMVDGDNSKDWLSIVNAHLRKDNRDMFDLQSELIDAGYESIAQL